MTRHVEIGLNSKQTKNKDRLEVGSGWSGLMSVWDVSGAGMVKQSGDQVFTYAF